jgi:hypothetical protein
VTEPLFCLYTFSVRVIAFYEEDNPDIVLSIEMNPQEW